MSRSVLAFGVLFFVTFTIAQTKPANPHKTQLPSTEATSSAAVLPVKRVVLYKNGVGYFEHTARVHGTQDLSIDSLRRSSTMCSSRLPLLISATGESRRFVITRLLRLTSD